jgi:DNA repair protein RecO (recombination protein O)
VRPETTTAIVLRSYVFGESDKIVTLLTRSSGKLNGIAKGAKRSLRRFGGALELFSHIQIDLRQKRTAELAFLERAVLVRPWRGLLTSLERYAAASHVVEIADKMTAEREVGDRLYSVVAGALARLDRDEPGPMTLRLYELAALSACGYRYDFGACALCRRELAAVGGRSHLGDGGMVCSRCAGDAPPGPAVTSHAMAGLARLQSVASTAVPLEGSGRAAEGDFYAAERSLASIGSAAEGEIARVLALLLGRYVRGRLRSLELLGPLLRR